jgi:secreted Zn-dependent insulinase-like peptidase
MDIDHDDASIVLHAQDPDDSFASRARSALAAQLLQPAYFQELRTEQQLGYVVSVTNRPVVRRGGISFVVQSPVASAGALEEATLRFLDDFIEHWPQVSAAEFDSQKAGLLNRLLQTPKNLNEQTQLYWSDLLDRQLTFDSQERIAEQVRVLSQSDMAEFFDGLRDQLSQRRLLIYSSGKFSETPTLGRTLESPVAPF